MKTDMYNPANGSHYLASSSQIKILERSGWVVYADWLAQQGNTPTPDPTPAPAPAASDPAPADTSSTTSSTDTVPAPTL